MRRLAVGAVLVGTALLSGTAALACGDKLLAIGRGVRFQRAYAAHQANLVIYSAGTQSGATLGSTKLQTTLKRAGHKVQIAEGGSQLDEALKSGKVDVVLVDFADLGEITRLLQSAPSKPVILPILFKPSKAELAAAQKEYKFALKAPADDVQYLTAIDEAMKSKLRASAKS
jgi:ABC-type amino acid transport substrate-binding protein